MHRYIINPLPTFEVDHKDGDTLNNCEDNLWPVTTQMNSQFRTDWIKKHGPRPKIEGDSQQNPDWDKEDEPPF